MATEVKWKRFGEILDKPAIRRAVNEAANDIAENARAWGEEHRVTGNYAAGITVTPAKARDGRPVARASATAPHSALLEYGTGRGGPAFAPMRNAASAAGYALD